MNYIFILIANFFERFIQINKLKEIFFFNCLLTLKVLSLSKLVFLKTPICLDYLN